MELITQSIGSDPKTHKPLLYLRLKIDLATIDGMDVHIRNRYLSAAFLEILEDVLAQYGDNDAH